MPETLTPEQQALQDRIVTCKALWQRWLHTSVSRLRGKRNSCWSERKGVFHKKVDYKSQATAEKSARKLTFQYGRVMDCYQCPFCRGWHVGNAANLTVGKFFSILWVWILRRKRTGPKERPWEAHDGK